MPSDHLVVKLDWCLCNDWNFLNASKKKYGNEGGPLHDPNVIGYLLLIAA